MYPTPTSHGGRWSSAPVCSLSSLHACIPLYADVRNSCNDVAHERPSLSDQSECTRQTLPCQSCLLHAGTPTNRGRKSCRRIRPTLSPSRRRRRLNITVSFLNKPLFRWHVFNSRTLMGAVAHGNGVRSPPPSVFVPRGGSMLPYIYADVRNFMLTSSHIPHRPRSGRREADVRDINDSSISVLVNSRTLSYLVYATMFILMCGCTFR